MPEVSEITYTATDVVKCLLRDQGIEEGQWMFQVNFGFKALNAPSQAAGELAAGTLVVINHLGLKRIDEGSPAIPGLTVDAATGETVGTMEALEEATEKV